MHPYEIFDVFTDTPLAGNALAVFTEGEHVPSRLMQAAARELNLSETVFLLPGDSDCEAHARIFTPLAELPFAGHPVLGAAFSVGGRRSLETIRLRTGAGIITIRLTRDHDGTVIGGEMDQPLPSVAPFARAGRLLAALSLEAPALPIESYTNGPTHVMIALDDPDRVRAMRPDLGALAELGPYGFACFAPLAPAVYRTRLFAPGLGVAEDPATGSAAGPIAVHLLRHAHVAAGTAIELRQGAEIGRPSTLHATASGSAEEVTRVTVGGAAVLVATGSFRLQ